MQRPNRAGRCFWCWIVSILTRPEGRVQLPASTSVSSQSRLFQSSPGQKAGCNGRWRQSGRSPCPVSILTRPEGRVQPGPAPAPNCTRWFQSSPGQKAGCNGVGVVSVQSYVTGFQSSPGQKAGCNDGAWVSDLPRSPVSILTRPEGRVQPILKPRVGGSKGCFNPHPARRPGATSTRQGMSGSSQCFNPHPARRPGATWPSPILRLQPRGFNPHPARRPGATYGVPTTHIPLPTFQSSPGQKAGCNPRIRPRCAPPSCFNPHPARRPGATSALHSSQSIALGCFNPHPARRPGATSARVVLGRRDSIRVSILTRPEGRVQPLPPPSCLDRRDSIRFNPHPARRPGATPGGSQRRVQALGSFNPHPARRPGATPPPTVLVDQADLFQSSPGQKAGCNLMSGRCCHL